MAKILGENPVLETKLFQWLTWNGKQDSQAEVLVGLVCAVMTAYKACVAAVEQLQLALLAMDESVDRCRSAKELQDLDRSNTQEVMRSAFSQLFKYSPHDGRVEGEAAGMAAGLKRWELVTVELDAARTALYDKVGVAESALSFYKQSRQAFIEACDKLSGELEMGRSKLTCDRSCAHGWGCPGPERTALGVEIPTVLELPHASGGGTIFGANTPWKKVRDAIEKRIASASSDASE